MTRLQKVWQYLVAIVLPNRCICCGELIPPPDTVCLACETALSVIKPPICPYCAHTKADCSCRKHRHLYDKIASPFYYENSAKGGVLRLKRIEDPKAVKRFADMRCTVVKREYGEEHIDRITYVPMTGHALREREFNQSKSLATAVAKRLALPVTDTLVKLYETPPQKKLGLRTRSGNVLGVFDVTDPSVRGQTILLVDDVVTTGATLNECAKMLKLYGAKRVLVVTVAVRKYEKKKDEIT